MHPEARGGINARKTVLYPTFNLSPAQTLNFERHKISVLRDDEILKPPNPSERALLEAVRDQDLSISEVIERDGKVLEKLYGEAAWNATLELVESERLKNSSSSLTTPSSPDPAPSRSFVFPTQAKALVFPAALKPAKGQLDLINLLSHQLPLSAHAADQLRGLHIYFAGGCAGNTTYCSQLVQRCAQLTGQKVVTCTFLGVLTKKELFLVYKQTQGTILYSKVDCNPRVLYESLLMGRPFFGTEEAQIPGALHNVGHVVRFGEEENAEELGLFVQSLVGEKNMWGERPREVAVKEFGEREVYGKVLEWVDRAFWGEGS